MFGPIGKKLFQYGPRSKIIAHPCSKGRGFDNISLIICSLFKHCFKAIGGKNFCSIAKLSFKRKFLSFLFCFVKQIRLKIRNKGLKIKD